MNNSDSENIDYNSKYKLYHSNLKKNLKVIIRFSQSYTGYKKLLT